MSDPTVYISIGNSDDKLSQADWARFFHDMLGLVEWAGHRPDGGQIHGIWSSSPFSPFQNVCFCLVPVPGRVYQLKADLGDLAVKYRQDSIAWAEAATTEFIGPQATGEAGLAAEPQLGTYFERAVLRRFIEGGPVDLATIRTQVAALLAQHDSREASGACSCDAGWVIDENWSPDHPGEWDGRRWPGAGLIRCGLCDQEAITDE